MSCSHLSGLLCRLSISIASVAAVVSAAEAAPSPVVVPGEPVVSLAFLAQVHEGWQFVPLTNMTVFALGFGDPNGLDVPHDVGLFRTSDGQLLASATITSADVLQGHYRYSTIGPMNLNAGLSYQLVGTFPSVLDSEVIGILGQTAFNQVNYQGFSGDSGAVLAPVGTQQNPLLQDINGFVRLSTNLLFVPTSIPEPAAYALLGLGLAVVAVARNQKHARTSGDSA